MKESGQEIRSMAKEDIFTIVQMNHMMDNGLKEKKVDMVKPSMLMEINMKDTSQKVRGMELE